MKNYQFQLILEERPTLDILIHGFIIQGMIRSRMMMNRQQRGNKSYFWIERRWGLAYGLLSTVQKIRN
ncbi:unnamed protein product [Paramecium octaurelia]|uniref:Uncharacterized protein n=1 Tax=Paramecium octaurelia TaxID=43137 RepID=A0A8S1XRU9_PAROT|nr:unnamed protein product [Paramecium octaurelia]